MSTGYAQSARPYSSPSSELCKLASLLIKLGHIKEEDSEFAFNFDPLINNLVKLSYVKDLHGFDLKLNSSYNFDSPIPEYGTDIEVSTSF